jgi:hypothetical protein
MNISLSLSHEGTLGHWKASTQRQVGLDHIQALPLGAEPPGGGTRCVGGGFPAQTGSPPERRPASVLEEGPAPVAASGFECRWAGNVPATGQRPVVYSIDPARPSAQDHEVFAQRGGRYRKAISKTAVTWDDDPYRLCSQASEP